MFPRPRPQPQRPEPQRLEPRTLGPQSLPLEDPLPERDGVRVRDLAWPGLLLPITQPTLPALLERRGANAPVAYENTKARGVFPDANRVRLHAPTRELRRSWKQTPSLSAKGRSHKS